jgi:prepilin-type N-terminal cleavage/methylation domain-containing protein/prepilin-type processing-associated H-X9-DG protein
LTLCNKKHSAHGITYAQINTMRCTGIDQMPKRPGLDSAFTLVEMLVVCAIIGIFAALFLPALARAKVRAQRVVCISNLRQIGTSFTIFAHDAGHHDQFPVRVSTNSGGASEYIPDDVSIAEVFQVFQSVSYELSTPKLVHCPRDSRPVADSFADLQANNVSYFVGTQATPNEPGFVAAGDRNVTFRPDGYNWSSELHNSKGNLLFADNHVEEVGSWAFVLAASPPAPSEQPSDSPTLNDPSTPPQGNQSTTANAAPSSDAQRANPSPQQQPHPTGANKSGPQNAFGGSSPFAGTRGAERMNINKGSRGRKTAAATIVQTQDEVPDLPAVKFFAGLIHIGFYVSLLWALILLLMLLLKKIRDHRAEHEEHLESLRETTE